MFVIFVPSKQFEEGWWTQDCAHATFIQPKTGAKKGDDDSSRMAGIDLDESLEQCRQEAVQKQSASNNPRLTTANIVYLGTQPRKFKDWSPKSLELFRQ